MPWTCEACGGWKNCDQGAPPGFMGRGECECLAPADAIEALALGAAGIEWHHAGNGKWLPISADTTWSARDWMSHKFRLARPKRSRVQEMAEARWAANARPEDCNPRTVDVIARHETIRAVCDALKKHEYPVLSAGSYAAWIEREFLEPR